MNKKILELIPVLIVTITIFIGSELRFYIPIGTGEKVAKFSILTLIHIGEFTLFSITLMFAFYPKIKSELLCLISISYGILDELHQFIVPTRFFDMMDIMYDTWGAILGIAAFFILQVVYKKIKRGKKNEK